MPLHKIKDFDPDFSQHFDDRDITGYDLYSGNEKVGSVQDLLVDDEGRFRYLVISTGIWIFGKQVLLPIGRSRIDDNAHRVYVDGLTREQVEQLPEYTGQMPVDYDYEEQVRGVYRPTTTGQSLSPIATDDRTPATIDQDRIPAAVDRTPATIDQDRIPATVDRDTYRYDQDAALYNLNDRDHQNLRLYEERLIANKQRQKTGEVIVGKRVETEQAQVEVPVERERVVIERTTPTDAGQAVAPGEATFSEGEVARVEVYEETPDIHKEAFVREEVNVRKEVDRDTVEAEDQVRREELDLDTQGQPTIDRNSDARSGERI